ncbi:hypothetical protein P245_14505 [Comamonas thiooxydans]|uniref:Uncharacterized protein n=1 Tax=Comamonas thiooxydans TaxID=363952 RepID=A0A0E3BJK4_9BURK|nr:hypothetical protein P245_14505 [Comamonas thiooxydans]
MVFEAIRQIHDAGGEPTRERIVALTGLKPTTVDDRIKVLRGEGMISPLKQCYRPLHQHVAAQAVSCTVMPNGIYKIEKGDEVMTLVPAEARQLAPMLAGKALEASALERVQEIEARMVEMARTLQETERRYKALYKKRVTNLDQQLLGI